MEQQRDLRRQERFACDHHVAVMWRGARGEERFTNAKALDICKSGLRLQMPEALSRQDLVSLNASALGLAGPASVRHCSRLRGSHFAVGLEFTAGLKWMPKQ